MKYIRTKEGIYELMPNIEQDNKVSFDNETLEPAYYTINTDWIAKKDVIKQADTIEELCDEFVMFCPNAPRKKIRVYNTMSSISLYFKRDKRWNGNMVDKVYGAIWTDKGLIYVAKMNDKGELELL